MKRKFGRCGNGILQARLQPNRPLLRREERYVGQRAEFGCQPPLTLGRYRRRITYVEVDKSDSRGLLRTQGIETLLVERKEHELVLEFAL